MEATSLDQIERRHLERQQLVEQLRLFDRDTRDLLGHVIDVSLGGLCLVAARRFEPEEEVFGWMELPRGDSPARRVFVDLRGMWSEPGTRPSVHRAGFAFSNPTTTTVDALTKLVERLHAS